MEKPRHKPIKLYIPRVIADQIWAQSSKKTEIRFSQTNICRKHNEELTPAHMRTCENFKDEGNLDDLIKTLKKSNIREWQRPDIVKGITDAIRITCRVHYLQQVGEVIPIKKDR